jgi:hypothetical protein
LEECDSIEGALAKLKVQKDHVENKIRKFTETQRGQLVAGCMDVVNARAGYVRVKDKIQAHRENLLNSKIVMATMSRNIRALLFDQDLCETSLGYLMKIKACQNCENMVSKYLQKQEFGKATELILENLRFTGSKEMDLVVSVKLLKTSVEKQRSMLIGKLDERLGELLYEQVDVRADESELREKIRTLSSLVHKLLFVHGSENCEGPKPKTSITKELYKLKVSQNAQRFFHDRCCTLLRKYAFRNQQDYLNNGQWLIYHLMKDLLGDCRVYMERFWYFFIGGGLERGVDVGGVPPPSWKEKNKDNQLLFFVWSTVQMDLIDILQRHYEDNGANYSKSSNAETPPSVPGEARNPLRAESLFSFSNCKGWPTLASPPFNRGNDPPEKTNRLASPEKVHDEFSTLLICEPSLYHAVAVNPMVKQLSSDIDAWVETWSMHGGGNTSTYSSWNELESISAFVLRTNDLLSHCVKSSIISEMSAICDAPAAFDTNCTKDACVPGGKVKIFASSFELVAMIESWYGRMITAKDTHVNEPGFFFNRTLFGSLQESIQSAVDRYSRLCKRLVEDHADCWSVKRLANHSVAMPQSGCTCTYKRFLESFFSRDHVDDGIKAELTQQAHGLEHSGDADPMDARSFSLLEYDLMEKSLRRPGRHAQDCGKADDGLASDFFPEGCTLLPMTQGLDCMACIYTSLVYLKSKIETLGDRFTGITNHAFSTDALQSFSSKCIFAVHASLRLRCHWRLNAVPHQLRELVDPVYPCLQLLCNDLAFFFENIFPMLDSTGSEFCAAGLGSLIGTILIKHARAILQSNALAIADDNSAAREDGTRILLGSFVSLQQAMLGYFPGAFTSAEKVLEICRMGGGGDDRVALANAGSCRFSSFEIEFLKEVNQVNSI